MDGYTINTGYFTAHVQIRGTFESATDTFDPKRHPLLFLFNQGPLLRKETPNLEIQIMGVGDNVIFISHVVDKKTGAANEVLTPGGMLKIKGSKLKIVGDKPEIGVYFQNANYPAEEHKVADNDIIVNNPGELIVEIPPYLSYGQEYKLIIRNQYTGAALLKDVREGVFDKVLIV